MKNLVEVIEKTKKTKARVKSAKKKKDQIDEVDYVDRYENSDKVITELETSLSTLDLSENKTINNLWFYCNAMELHLFLNSKTRVADG